ncbi:MAG TPA: WhiB family transcriptional regulator [Micromonosporaceae bacterium]|jgi:WhiB family redox-sensing transcriptional regulator|nr:WhiB family transcriptional regulator [Micromonosporaceae bacterium]
MSLALAPFQGAVEAGRELPCRQYDADLWFSDTPAELEVAKALCGECPLRVECLASAVERREPWGVWGGEIFERGAVVARKRPRGRPRKDAAAADAHARAQARARAEELSRTARATEPARPVHRLTTSAGAEDAA